MCCVVSFNDCLTFPVVLRFAPPPLASGLGCEITTYIKLLITHLSACTIHVSFVRIGVTLCYNDRHCEVGAEITQKLHAIVRKVCDILCRTEGLQFRYRMSVRTGTVVTYWVSNIGTYWYSSYRLLPNIGTYWYSSYRLLPNIGTYWYSS